MKSFDYVITDDQGIHARPAGLLVKSTSTFNSSITISKAGKEIDAKKIIGVMSLGAKKGEKVTLTANGDDESTAIETLKTFFKENL